MHNLKLYLETPDDCVAVSSSEADFFLSQDIKKNTELPIPGIFYPKDNDAYGILIWAKLAKKYNRCIPIFKDNADNLRNLQINGIFKPLGHENIIYAGYDYYMFTNEPRQGLTINKIAINGDENIAKAIAEMRGYINMDFVISKLYLIGRVKKYLTSMWIGYGEDQKTGEATLFFAPIFPEDVKIFQKYDVNEIAREGMDTGDYFIHNDHLWQIAKDEDGFYIHQPSPYMRISHKQN